MIQLYLQLLDTQTEQEKFERLYYQYKRLMYWIANHILGDSHLAEDAVHEAFLKIIKNFHKIGEIHCPRTKNFVVIIVRNTARSILEKENRGPKTQSFTEDFAGSDMAEASDSYWENLSSGFDETLDEVLRKEIMRTVDSLPDWAADVLTLSAIYGCSTAEIAAIGGSGKKTIAACARFVSKQDERGRDEMNSAEFQCVLAEALERRYASIPDPEELSFDYEFSPQFERKMKRMIRRFDHIQGKEQRAERKENNFRFRRVAVFALVLVLLMALAACAVHYIIIWNEENNEKQGTLDVTFELENPNTEDLFTFKEPVVPDSYTREVTFRDGDIQDIEYTDEKSGKTILYHQTGISESMGLSIGNEDESFTQIEINGFKGYAETEGETPFIVWSDGISLYTISSNISFDELFVIAESIQ